MGLDVAAEIGLGDEAGALVLGAGFFLEGLWGDPGAAVGNEVLGAAA